ncbi:ABC transporter membrane protein [Salmonella enterica subsp. enterica]|uniref:ABC transporter membrane protein n=1 Tax=Salmonella enterica I TaxID=59201 RepID=A0A3S4IEA9_SALET|nr:ABC transporter membrane protein [Salmonella enterica subsp. enterica]
MNPWRRYSWEIALAALLIFEILAFGLINPRLLDINVLLFSTSDFICIGIVALPLTMVYCQRWYGYFIWFYNRAMRDYPGCAVSARYAATFSDYYYPTTWRNMWADKCRTYYLYRRKTRW